MLDFFKEIISSIKNTALERVKSPILGAFAFSWLAFNWEAIAILLFSKSDIEQRIIYITYYSNLKTFLIYPFCIALFLSWLLPELNKLVTKLQVKPNSQTIGLILDAKIVNAGKEQTLAEIKARKQLAYKKEEKEIEENINNIKNEKNNLQSEFDQLQDSHRKLTEWFDAESDKTKSLTDNLNALNATIEKLNHDNDSYKAQLASAGIKFEEQKNTIKKLETRVRELIENINIIQERLNSSTSRHISYIDEYSNLFQPNENGDLSLVKPEARDVLSEANRKAKMLQKL